MPKPHGLTQLAVILEQVDPSPEQPKPTVVFDNPPEQINLEDCPLIIVSLAPNVDQFWKQETLGQPGLVQHDYVATVWVVLGMYGTGLADLHDRAQYWSEAIATVLFANLKLNQSVVRIGFLEDNRTFSYKVGPILWGNDVMYGLTIQLPMRETVSMTVAP